MTYSSNQETVRKKKKENIVTNGTRTLPIISIIIIIIIITITATYTTAISLVVPYHGKKSLHLLKEASKSYWTFMMFLSSFSWRTPQISVVEN